MTHPSLFEQMNLPDAPSLFHRNDPDTSKLAATRNLVKRGNERYRLLQAFSLADLTYDEAGERSGVTAVYEARRRSSELKSAGMIEDTGERRLSNSGNPSMVCRATLKGRTALLEAK